MLAAIWKSVRDTIMGSNMLDRYNDHGQTALHVAEVNRHVELADLLVTSGAQSLPMLPCMVDDCNNTCRIPHDCQAVHNGS